MALSSSLDLAMAPGFLLHRLVVTHAPFIQGRGRSASGRRSRNLALSASSSNDLRSARREKNRNIALRIYTTKRL